MFGRLEQAYNHANREINNACEEVNDIVERNTRSLPHKNVTIGHDAVEKLKANEIDAAMLLIDVCGDLVTKTVKTYLAVYRRVIIRKDKGNGVNIKFFLVGPRDPVVTSRAG